MAAEAGRAAGARLQVENLGRVFTSSAETVHAVRDVSFSADDGQFIAIYGASGSGKTTLLSLIAGLDVADSGRVVVDGREVGPLSEAGRARLRLDSIGVVFQGDNLIEEFTAIENVALPLEVRGTVGARAAEQAAEQLARVGLTGLGERFPAQLSGGQRQRVGIARALAGDRRVLLADEPTGALDSAASLALFTLLRELCDQGTLVVVGTHDPACERFADAVHDMADGRLRARSGAFPAVDGALAR